jgi:hypothetical protein
MKVKDLWHNRGQVWNSLQGVEQTVQFSDITVDEGDQWAGLDVIWTGLFPNKIPNLLQNELSKYALSVRNDGSMGRTLITQTQCLISDIVLLYGVSFKYVVCSFCVGSCSVAVVSYVYI